MTNISAVADQTLTTLHAIPRAEWPARGDKVIYFAGREGDDIKIGRTADFPQRMQHLSRLHGDVQLWGFVEGNNLDEHIYHHRFARDRHVGEWFRPSPALLQFITSLSRPSLAGASAS